MNSFINTTTLVLFMVFGTTSNMLSADRTHIKDSLLVISKKGRDKRYYKSCSGNDIKLISSFEKNQIEVVSVVNEEMFFLSPGRNDKMCGDKTSVLSLALNNLLTGKSKFRKLIAASEK